MKSKKTRIREKLLMWLWGEKDGTSSRCIAAIAADLPQNSRYLDPPSDPSDFVRCLRLLEVVPECREYLPKAAKISPAWAGIVEAWDDIEKQLISDKKRGVVRAKKAYDMIKKAINKYKVMP